MSDSEKLLKRVFEVYMCIWRPERRNTAVVSCPDGFRNLSIRTKKYFRKYALIGKFFRFVSVNFWNSLNGQKVQGFPIRHGILFIFFLLCRKTFEIPKLSENNFDIEQDPCLFEESGKHSNRELEKCLKKKNCFEIPPPPLKSRKLNCFAQAWTHLQTSRTFRDQTAWAPRSPAFFSDNNATGNTLYSLATVFRGPTR